LKSDQPSATANLVNKESAPTWSANGEAMPIAMTCPHDNLIIVWSMIGSSGNRLQCRSLREQCIDCGKLLGRSLPHSMATSDTPDVDEERARKVHENEQQAWLQGSREYVERREREDREWWDKYNEYLCSSEWHERRALVMDRAGGLCEGCRERQASQVNHLTYDHVTAEFLWELVAICDECHRRVHPHMAQS
jgi:hypothetical protein